MLRKKNGSLEWLEFEIFQPFSAIKHAVFLRHDPAGIGEFLQCSQLVSGRQVHGKEVEEVPLVNEACDGLITKQKGVGLLIHHADCQGTIFYDPVKSVIGCVHAGWRGSVQNIYGEAIKKMGQRFGSKPADLLVGVSPSLGPCCGEFINYKKELPEEFWSHQVRPLYFDFWKISRLQLEREGVLPHHIEIASQCTCCNRADFFSYRRDKTTKRHATVVALSDRR